MSGQNFNSTPTIASGNGASGKHQFATLSNHAAITAADFLVV